MPLSNVPCVARAGVQSYPRAWMPDNQKHSSLSRNIVNGTTCFENANNCLKTNTYSYLETSGGQSSNLYFNFVNFFNTSVN